MKFKTLGDNEKNPTSARKGEDHIQGMINHKGFSLLTNSTRSQKILSCFQNSEGKRLPARIGYPAKLSMSM